MTEKHFVQISKYRILGLVGRGQFGRVFCARNRKTGSLVALKELDQQRFPTSQFLRELRFLLSLQHENIVSCIALEHSRSTRYLVMEYCEAGTLRDLINPNIQLSQRQCIQLVIDILSGLEHAHSSNIIHCDVKPENVLLRLTQTGWQAKVSDFGIARLSQEVDKSGATGSPGYMAPERFYGQFSMSSDIYAVGVILYELLLRDRPFSGKPSQLMVAHINQRIEIPDTLPADLQSIITKALQKLPGRRFANATQMKQELLMIVNSESLDLELEIVKGSANSILNPISLSNFLSEQTGSTKIIALTGDDGSYIYSATASQLQRHKLSKPAQVEPLLKFNTDITDVAIAQNQKFVATPRSVYRLGKDKNTAIFRFTEDFDWIVSPNAKWVAAVTRTNLEIKNLVHPKSIKLSFGDDAIKAIAPIDQHHLAIVTSKPKATDSKIIVVSRKGHLMGQFAIPATIAQASPSNTINRLLLIEEHYPNHLLLVDLKPFRLNRIILAYNPVLVIPTAWGYVLTGDYSGESSGILGLLDAQGQNAGNLILEGKIAAIASISDHLLAVSTHTISGGKFYLIDLKQLDVDLIF